jgi:hypothetical protein
MNINAALFPGRYEKKTRWFGSPTGKYIGSSHTIEESRNTSFDGNDTLLFIFTGGLDLN